MKKVKKLLALIVAMTMVLGMAITVSAEGDSADITVTNTASASQGQYLQIIAPDPETRTGWTFINGAGSIFVEEFEAAGDTDEEKEQDAIDMLIAHAKPASEQGHEDHSAELSQALDRAAALGGFQDMDRDDDNNLTKTGLTSAGIYVIEASETGYTYQTMAAYVGFGVVSGGNYPALLDATLTAKKVPNTVTKSVVDPDHVVAVGDYVQYTITTQVPYISSTSTDKSFYIYDDITNDAASYIIGNSTYPTSVTITAAGSAEETVSDIVFDTSEEVVLSGETHGLVIDLTDLINDANSNAGKTVTVSYYVRINRVTVTNSAGSHIGGSESGGTDTVTVYTGQITLTKYDAEETDSYLAGAGFEVRINNSGNPLTFTADQYTVVDGNNVPVDGSYTYDPEGTITEVFTGSNGTLVIKGLNATEIGITYTFKETTAPNGFKIGNGENGIDTSATLTIDADDKDMEGFANVIIEAETDLANTRLSSLPSTGGIGTTIFTIGGCVIMIAAAALYFVNRRKSEEN